MRAETKFVKPIEGAMIRDPNTKAVIPKEGTEVPWIGKAGRFYRRRVNDGTLVICKEEKKSFYDNIKKIDDVLDNDKSKFKKTEDKK